MDAQTFENEVLKDLGDNYGYDRDNVEGILQNNIEDHLTQYLMGNDAERREIVANVSANIADEMNEAFGDLRGWDAFIAQLRHEVNVLEQTGNVRGFIDWVSLFLDVQADVKGRKTDPAVDEILKERTFLRNTEEAGF